MINRRLDELFPPQSYTIDFERDLFRTSEGRHYLQAWVCNFPIKLKHKKIPNNFLSEFNYAIVRVADPRTQKRHNDDCALLVEQLHCLKRSKSRLKNSNLESGCSTPLFTDFLTLLELCFDSFSRDVKTARKENKYSNGFWRVLVYEESLLLNLHLQDNKTCQKTEKNGRGSPKNVQKEIWINYLFLWSGYTQVSLPAAGINLNHRRDSQSRTRTLLLRSIAGPAAGHIPALQSR